MRMRLEMRVLVACGLLLVAGASARAMKHVTLRNGFELDCTRQEVVGERVRLYLLPAAGSPGEAAANYMEVAADAVVRVEDVPSVPTMGVPAEKRTGSLQQIEGQDHMRSGGTDSIPATPTNAEMREMLAHAGVEHRVDADLLASVMRAESGGQVKAVSRTGARGLMQLMPGTATAMGVKDAFVPEQNIDGGSAYLDWLLTRYHDDMALALAAYNAGPAAVDRYRGVPPFRETRAYVARVIREFNRRKLAEMAVARR